MAGENTELFRLDLDAKEFLAKVAEAQKSLKELGDSEGVAKLISTLKVAGAVIGVIAAAGFAAKKALDWTEEAESIKRVNYQFELLASQAGLSSKSIKEGLEKAADGLVDTDDLLKSANKGVVTLGANAAKLPEIFEAARKVTKVFGGDLVQNFESLNQAIASGQTRALRNMGIIVDSEVAYRKFANSIGVTVNSLTEAEKRTALMNAVLEKTKSSLPGTSGGIQNTSETVKRLTVTLKEMGDVLILAFEKVAGPTVRNVLNQILSFSKTVKRELTATFGEGAEQIDAQASKVETRLADLRAKLKSTQEKEPGFFSKLLFGSKEKQAADTESMIAVQETLLKTLKEKREKIAADEVSKAPAASPVGSAEQDAAIYAKRLGEKAKFEASLQELTLSRIASEEQIATSIEEADFLSGEKIVALRELRDAKLRELDAQRALQEIATDEELILKKQELEAKTSAEIVKIQNDQDTKRIESLRRFADYNKETLTGFVAGARLASAEASRNFTNFSALGQDATKKLGSVMTKAFLEIGAGSGKAAEVMKNGLLNAIADTAEAKGSELLLSGIWPPNPAALGAGAGLVALAGLIRSKAGGGESAGGIGASAAVASSGGASEGGALSSTMRPELPEVKKREVTVNIMGHYMETETTRRMLTELLRQESDATQFTIQQIGQGA